MAHLAFSSQRPVVTIRAPYRPPVYSMLSVEEWVYFLARADEKSSFAVWEHLSELLNCRMD